MEVENRKYLNILVITKSPWSDTNALGNTYSNFFSGWENCNFSNLYLREELPDNQICKKFFNITEKNILGNIITPKRIGREFSVNQISLIKSDLRYKDSVKREKYILDQFRNNGSVLFLILREVIWTIGNWKNNKLSRFVEDIDIIVVAASGPIYLQTIANYCLKKSNAKLVMLFTDDTYSYTSRRVLSYIYRTFIRSAIRKSVKNSKKLYGASEKLCQVYSLYFKKDIEPLYKGCLFEEKNYTKEYGFPIKIVYAGNLYYGRDKILAKLVDEIEKINTRTESFNLEIYTTSTITDQLSNSLNRGSSSKIMGSLSFEEVKQVLKNADIVLHVESFDSEHIKLTRLSFSTKIIDCMQSESCLMAIGPNGIASIDYLLGIDGVISITNLKDVRETLKSILRNPQELKVKADKLTQFAKKNHDIKKMQTKLKKDFLELFEEDED